MSSVPKPRPSKFSHRWPQHLREMKLPIERTRPLVTADNAVTLTPEDWIDDDELSHVAMRCGGLFTTTEQASWKAPYTSSPYELPHEFYLARPVSFYKAVSPTTTLVELPLLPIGRVIIPYHGSAGKDSAYGRDWAWMGLPRQTVEAIRGFLRARGVVLADDEGIKGQQVRSYCDKWWTLFQARFDECKIHDTSGLSRSNKMGLQFVLQQAKADLYAAVAWEVKLTYAGAAREYGEWRGTPMHLHFSPKLIAVTGERTLPVVPFTLRLALIAFVVPSQAPHTPRARLHTTKARSASSRPMSIACTVYLACMTSSNTIYTLWINVMLCLPVKRISRLREPGASQC